LPASLLRIGANSVLRVTNESERLVDREQYWNLVDKARPRSNDPERHCTALIRSLQRLPATDILDFECIFWRLVKAAYRRDLWGVVASMTGFCSDDGFAYFRWWFVMQGQDVFETALADPESLAEITGGREELPECEEYAGVARAAYEAATGKEMPDNLNLGGPSRLRGRTPGTQRGFRRKYPMLWRLLRDPPAIAPAWLKWKDGVVKRLAQSIHEERRWDELPILADALEEAGCAEPFLLDHLRAGRRHARSCWVTHFLRRKKPRSLD
jgi:hypothetical protein